MAIPQGRKRRTFRVVSRQLQQQLAAQFTVLAACSETSIEDWSLLAVTPFSHWLSQAEFNQQFTERSASEQPAIRQQWREFYQLLVTSTPCYQAKYRCGGRLIFKAPKSSDLVIERLLRSATEPQLTLVLPEFNAVFEQGGDDTCWLHFASLKTMEPLLARIRKQGMHLLSPA
ncbi:hypothetical protein L9G74_04570 [Shewanella sp. C32]|uniref:Uncharacterized protein n=1 Tax=Shewanella electrica TaxID=515560 RepID=A0ABT2FH91_9GAMM|nr:hypothetical protein [Shewanella electrica]MCH1923606.1 hypothetical protein [Shewanella electrica]MCS4555702.1 hypothetical protein [Shewanella electrica]